MAVFPLAALAGDMQKIYFDAQGHLLTKAGAAVYERDYTVSDCSGLIQQDTFLREY